MITVSRQKGPMMPGGASSRGFFVHVFAHAHDFRQQGFAKHDGEVADDGVGWVYVDFELLACGNFAD